MYAVYILRSLRTGQYYIGQTNDLSDRLLRHDRGEVLATKAYRPWKLVHREVFSSRSDAVRREYYLKSLKNKEYLKQYILKHSGVEQSGSSPGP
ncbi:MAG: GIY-YIG nuclease family protein [Patescibacteria group bacterium]